MTKVYSRLYNMCETPLSIPMVKKDVNKHWNTNWDALNDSNCTISLGLEHGETADRHNTAEIQQMDFHLTKKTRHVSEIGIGKWFSENWKTINKFCKTYGLLKALINNARAGFRNGLFPNGSRILNGDEVFDNANCNVHREHFVYGRSGICNDCELIHAIRDFQVKWENLCRDSKGAIVDIPLNILSEFIQLMKFMLDRITFPDNKGGINFCSFMVNTDEIFVGLFKVLLNNDRSTKMVKKDMAKLDARAADFVEIAGFYQRSFQNVHDDINVDWFLGPGGDGDQGFIMGTRIRIIVVTFRTLSIDMERILNCRITRSLDILGRPRDPKTPDNVLMIGTKRSRVKRRWSDGDLAISNDRNEVCRGLLYEFLNGINDFKNFTRDPEAIFFYLDN